MRCHVKSADSTRLTYAAADSDLFLTPTPMSFSSVSPLTPPTRLTMFKKRSVPCRATPAGNADPGAQWISEVLHFCQGLPIVLVACKKDLRDDGKTIQDLARMNQRPVSRAEGMAVAQKIGAQGYVECSAKTGEGVREVFQTATRHALQVGLLPLHRRPPLTVRRAKSPSLAEGRRAVWCFRAL